MRDIRVIKKEFQTCIAFRNKELWILSLVSNLQNKYLQPNNIPEIEFIKH